MPSVTNLDGERKLATLQRLSQTWLLAWSQINSTVARVQYAYIEKPKMDQTSLHQPKAPLA